MGTTQNARFDKAGPSVLAACHPVHVGYGDNSPGPFKPLAGLLEIWFPDKVWGPGERTAGSNNICPIRVNCLLVSFAFHPLPAIAAFVAEPWFFKEVKDSNRVKLVKLNRWLETLPGKVL